MTHSFWQGFAFTTSFLFPPDYAPGDFYDIITTYLLRNKVIVQVLARVAELADALASGASDSNIVQVQPLSRAPSNIDNPMVVYITYREIVDLLVRSNSYN